MPVYSRVCHEDGRLEVHQIKSEDENSLRALSSFVPMEILTAKTVVNWR